MTSVGFGFGIVALAAYQPPAQLFARQLLSIQAQTYSNFRCLISVDGDHEDVAATVRSICGDDDRFEVVGFAERLGFYGNFERVLAAVPSTARWIALSDQDDYWYPEKLATLLPHLDGHSLVSGQARVTRDNGEVLTAGTERRQVPLVDLFSENQVTGSLSVLRTELLSVALPFPQLNTPAQYHDHWLGVCAGASQGYFVVETLVQDYIQHQDNVVGENRTGLRNIAGRVRTLARTFEGSASPPALARFLYKAGIGWRKVMADTLATRTPAGSVELAGVVAAYSSSAVPGAAAVAVVRGVRRKTVPLRRAVELLASLAAAVAVGPGRTTP
ncbi:glycosyltransferase [Arthrobacter sp. NamB2]|uniref:glycosyltransferase n=1 Tax=Arthrobacter sp. NamB2 TaxID=2576035 RepID=UPI0010C98065|nr:glycosyltransferase [Arthrobacter sp. NamB2]TKV29708.1 glycosyltransferase [Arthrobacter sp. NamB2]